MVNQEMMRQLFEEREFKRMRELYAMTQAQFYGKLGMNQEMAHKIEAGGSVAFWALKLIYLQWVLNIDVDTGVRFQAD